MYSGIGIRVRRIRKKQNLTQEKLSEAVGISASFLGHIERGTRKMSVDTLYRIAKTLNCSADTLLGIEDAEKHSSTREEIKSIIDQLQNIKKRFE